MRSVLSERVCECTLASKMVRASVGCVCVCVHARARARTCARACLSACVCSCVCARACVRERATCDHAVIVKNEQLLRRPLRKGVCRQAVAVSVEGVLWGCEHKRTNARTRTREYARARKHKRDHTRTLARKRSLSLLLRLSFLMLTLLVTCFCPFAWLPLPLDPHSLRKGYEAASFLVAATLLHGLVVEDAVLLEDFVLIRLEQIDDANAVVRRALSRDVLAAAETRVKMSWKHR
eukprot:6192578-Pleurochrysis_carterae.AAC.1